MRTRALISCFIYTYFILAFLGCGKNKEVVFTDINATILQVKYACGTGCDATGFIIKTSGMQLYTPIGLPPEFRVNELSVKIQFTRSGKFPISFTAPSYELIRIEGIEK